MIAVVVLLAVAVEGVSITDGSAVFCVAVVVVVVNCWAFAALPDVVAVIGSDDIEMVLAEGFLLVSSVCCMLLVTEGGVVILTGSLETVIVEFMEIVVSEDWFAKEIIEELPCLVDGVVIGVQILPTK